MEPSQRVLDHFRVCQPLFQSRQKLPLQAVLPNRQGIAAHAAVAMAGAAVAHISSFTLTTDDHEPRLAPAAKQKTREQVGASFLCTIHATRLSDTELLTGVRDSGLHCVPESIRHNAPLRDRHTPPFLFRACLADLAPSLRVENLPCPVPDV